MSSCLCLLRFLWLLKFIYFCSQNWEDLLYSIQIYSVFAFFDLYVPYFSPRVVIYKSFGINTAFSYLTLGVKITHNKFLVVKSALFRLTVECVIFLSIMIGFLNFFCPHWYTQFAYIFFELPSDFCQYFL